MGATGFEPASEPERWNAIFVYRRSGYSGMYLVICGLLGRKIGCGGISCVLLTCFR
jgi:hypothetical protein